jgi:hypothetical protein
LALNNTPAAKAYQQAMFQQSQPAAMFFTDDVKGDYERIKGRGAEFTMPPTDVTASTIATLNDTCGNPFRSRSWHDSRGGEGGSDSSNGAERQGNCHLTSECGKYTLTVSEY